MRIGIATIAENMNYGQRLQNYAVEQTLLSMGHTPETITLWRNIFLTGRQRMILRCNILLKRGNYHTGNRALSFDRFGRKRMHFSRDVYPNGDFDRYDYVVCGSDQIWNLIHKTLFDHADYYFAEFMPPQKRIAFSASVGSNLLNEDMWRLVAEKADAMKAVSVREPDAAQKLRTLCKKPVEVTIDPVFLLSPAHWKSVARRPDYLRQGEPYILTYFLGAMSPTARSCLQKVSEALNVRVVSLQSELFRAGDNEQYFGTGPEEFVYLMANSTVTLTDSFHACAFSALFHRPFRWFSRTQGGDMNSRLENLFSMFSLGEWAVGSDAEPAEHYTYCDFSGYDRRIEAEKQNALRFLQRALSDREEENDADD